MILLDKPAGVSSFASLSAVKRAAGTRKVGHTGTLDPFATGLLIALVGPATRAARYFNGLGKNYVARIVFGTETDTDDATGTVTATAELPRAPDLGPAIEQFRGTITQLPPAYSAVHVDGRRAHEIARGGGRPEVKPRTVTVSRLEVTRVESSGKRLEQIEVALECSAGTYVRSIARDLGRSLGSFAHVSELRRTGVGPFRVTEAVSHEKLAFAAHRHDLSAALTRLRGFATCEISDQTAAKVADGKVIVAQELGSDAGSSEPGTERRLVLTHHHQARAVGHLENERFVYEMVLPAEKPCD